MKTANPPPLAAVHLVLVHLCACPYKRCGYRKHCQTRHAPLSTLVNKNYLQQIPIRGLPSPKICHFLQKHLRQHVNLLANPFSRSNASHGTQARPVHKAHPPSGLQNPTASPTCQHRVLYRGCTARHLHRCDSMLVTTTTHAFTGVVVIWSYLVPTRAHPRQGEQGTCDAARSKSLLRKSAALWCVFVERGNPGKTKQKRSRATPKSDAHIYVQEAGHIQVEEHAQPEMHYIPIYGGQSTDSFRPIRHGRIPLQ